MIIPNRNRFLLSQTQTNTQHDRSREEPPWGNKTASHISKAPYNTIAHECSPEEGDLLDPCEGGRDWSLVIAFTEKRVESWLVTEPKVRRVNGTARNKRIPRYSHLVCVLQQIMQILCTEKEIWTFTMEGHNLVKSDTWQLWSQKFCSFRQTLVILGLRSASWLPLFNKS